MHKITINKLADIAIIVIWILFLIFIGLSSTTIETTTPLINGMVIDLPEEIELVTKEHNLKGYIRNDTLFIRFDN